jgi:hypothetical protein
LELILVLAILAFIFVVYIPTPSPASCHILLTQEEMKHSLTLAPNSGVTNPIPKPMRSHFKIVTVELERGTLLYPVFITGDEFLYYIGPLNFTEKEIKTIRLGSPSNNVPIYHQQ